MAEESDRGLDVVEHRVGAPECVGEGRLVARLRPRQTQRLFEGLNGAARLTAFERNLSEACKRSRALVVGRGCVECLVVELLGGIELAEAKCDLGIEQRPVLRQEVAVEPGRKPVLAHSEAPAHLAEELERRDPLAGLDPRDIGGRAAFEGELALAQACALARISEPAAHLSRVVDMC